MNPLIQLKQTTSVLLVALGLACFGLSPAVQAVSPPPDGGYPRGNTAEGQNSLFSLTTGGYNTAVGFFSLRSDTAGAFNTAIGAGTLLANNADNNTATGAGALLSNTTGVNNTANGLFALLGNTVGGDNTASGAFALQNNTTGDFNTASGVNALFFNTTGSDNTANGIGALFHNTTGGNNSAFGEGALAVNTTGTNNIAVGFHAGISQDVGSNNIYIGDSGFGAESNHIAIGAIPASGVNYTATFIGGVYDHVVTERQVYVNSTGGIGTLASSRRYKEDIRSMDKTSEALFALKPVVFRYKQEVDPSHRLSFGLIAEDVAEVSADLVSRDKEGNPKTVRYDAVNAMLLNEFLKEHRKVEELKKDFQATIARQQTQIEALTAGLQKVSAQLEASKPALQVVNNP